MDDIDPLTRQQQLFLQRFLASHVLTDNEAQSLFEAIIHSNNNRNELGSDVKDTLSRINRSLKPAFRLEIKSVSLALRQPKPIDDDEEEDNTISTGPTLYHSIVNCDPDEVSKSCANPTFTKNPHELAYFRLVLEKFIEIETHNDDTTTSSSRGGRGSRRGKGCASYMRRMDMINLRTELTGAHQGKVSIDQAESTLNLLEMQGWLVAAIPPSEGGLDLNGAVIASPDASSSSRRASRKRMESGGSSSNSGIGRVVGGRSKYLQIGPRCYLEFPDFLVKAGLENDKLPQFLLHG